jgi:hypothetical protein
MIEFDVDMDYLLEDDELDEVILNDENGEHESMRFVRERTCHNASRRLDESRFHCSECWFGCWVKDVSDGRDKLPSYCPSCGAEVVER